jgi:hypothetical protein
VHLVISFPLQEPCSLSSGQKALSHLLYGVSLVVMDPLSITASVVGITTAALQSVQFLAKTIGNVKDAPDTVRSVGTDLQAVEPVLQNLDKALQDGTTQFILSNQIKYAVENCDRACKVFQSQVEHWMKHSTEDKMFWMDRWKIGLFGLERIKTFRGQLSDCKGTLSVALSTATMYLPSSLLHNYDAYP